MNGQGETVEGTSAVGTLLMLGILLAALTEAIAGSVLALGRDDMLGDTYATPDEFAWLDISYTACKLVGFLLAPWLLARWQSREVIVWATAAMGLACAGAAASADLGLLTLLRAVQGMAGGTLLVAGQALLFLAFPSSQQAWRQAAFAMAAVVAPGTLAPALQGWLIDSQSWAWIFFAVVPLAMAAIGLLLLAPVPACAALAVRRHDWGGYLLGAASLASLAYVFGQGNRWDWFEAGHIIATTALGVGALLALLGQQLLRRGTGALDFRLFRSSDFSFAFIVSFVAGAALFGSAYLIPAFALSVLAFTPSEAGLLLLPSAVTFIATLLLAAWLIQARGVAPFATVPFGILLIMLAMWLLSGSTSQSGAADMMAGVLLRGLGLGLLFLSITLIAFGELEPSQLAAGIGLFNIGRQLGGLMGVAGLQTLIDHERAVDVAALGAHVTASTTAVIERLAGTAALLEGGGMDAMAAGRAALALLGRALAGQAAVLAFDRAFAAVTLLFAIAAPLLVCIKRLFARLAGPRV